MLRLSGVTIYPGWSALTCGTSAPLTFSIGLSALAVRHTVWRVDVCLIFKQMNTETTARAHRKLQQIFVSPTWMEKK
jgi:hypothetical protein